MSRVRFLTAMAISSIVTDEVGELLILDGRATPPLAFEWLLIEGFVRKKLPLPTGVPGTTKARGVLSRNGRLGASPYLQPPGVFGSHGIYQPLASALVLVPTQPHPAEEARARAVAVERDNELLDFVLQRHP